MDLHAYDSKVDHMYHNVVLPHVYFIIWSGLWVCGDDPGMLREPLGFAGTHHWDPEAYRPAAPSIKDHLDAVQPAMGADSIALAASQCSKLLGFAGTSYQDIQRLPPSIAEVGVLGRRSSRY